MAASNTLPRPSPSQATSGQTSEISQAMKLLLLRRILIHTLCATAGRGSMAQQASLHLLPGKPIFRHLHTLQQRLFGRHTRPRTARSSSPTATSYTALGLRRKASTTQRLVPTAVMLQRQVSVCQNNKSTSSKVVHLTHLWLSNTVGSSIDCWPGHMCDSHRKSPTPLLASHKGRRTSVSK